MIMLQIENEFFSLNCNYIDIDECLLRLSRAMGIHKKFKSSYHIAFYLLGWDLVVHNRKKTFEYLKKNIKSILNNFLTSRFTYRYDILLKKDFSHMLLKIGRIFVYEKDKEIDATSIDEYADKFNLVLDDYYIIDIMSFLLKIPAKL